MLWMRKKTGFAVTTLTSTEEAEFFLSKKGTATLGYFDKLEVSCHVPYVMVCFDIN